MMELNEHIPTFMLLIRMRHERVDEHVKMNLRTKLEQMLTSNTKVTAKFNSFSTMHD